MTLSYSYIIFLLSTSLLAIVTHMPTEAFIIRNLYCRDGPVKHTTHCTLSGALMQLCLLMLRLLLLMGLSLMLVRAYMILVLLCLPLHMT